MEETLLIEKSGYTKILKLNRTNQANSLSLSLLDALHKEVDELSTDKTVRSVIITGVGSSYFCSGADLKERRDMSIEQVEETVGKIGMLFYKIEKLPMPVIAAVNGIALGGGFELALACDIRVAQHNAIFGLPETSLGIIPGAGGTQRLARLIGIGKAKELIYTGRKIDSDEAEELGIIERLTNSEDALNVALSICEVINQNGPLAIRAAKSAIQDGYSVSIEEGLSFENEAYGSILHTNDRLEGLQAFKEKRKPQYKGV